VVIIQIHSAMVDRVARVAPSLEEILPVSHQVDTSWSKVQVRGSYKRLW